MGQFIPLERFEGMQSELPATNSTTFVKGQLAKMSSGYLANAAAGDDEVEYLVDESVVTTSAGQLVKVTKISDDTVFQAETGTTPVQATHVGNDYDLASSSTIDLTASTDKVFHIDEIIDASKKFVKGRFNKPAIA